MKKIVKLEPFFVNKIWGGHFLSQLKKHDTADLPLGETWEVSTLENGSSQFLGENLKDFIKLSYQVKFIDTQQNLSIQVHPNKDYALKKHNSEMGKDECWLILEAEKEAGLYIGFKKGVTKKEFFNALESSVSIEQFLNFIPVKKGDFFFLPAGAVHAIGKGITLCEVQQPTDITYRVWDWNRKDKDGIGRELHLEDAKNNLNFSDEFNEKLLASMKSETLQSIGISKLIKHNDFEVDLFSNMTQKEIELNLKKGESIICLSGSLSGEEKIDAFESAICLEDGLVKFKVALNTSFLIIS